MLAACHATQDICPEIKMLCQSTNGVRSDRRPQDRLQYL
jgi:hypothetical protein